MEFNAEKIDKIAKLAALEIEDEKKEELSAQMTKIFNWIEELQKTDTEGFGSVVNIPGQELRMRKDEVTDGDKREKVLSNAPEELHGHFAVPKVIE